MASTESEPELLAKAIAGDVHALSVLLLRRQPSLVRLIERQLPSELQPLTSAEDILQEVLTQAFKDIHTFSPDGEHAFERWLATIAHHRVLDAAKFHRRGVRDVRRNVRPGAINTDGDWETLLGELSCAGPTPSRATISREALAALRLAMTRLQPDHRTALELRYLRGLPVAEIARQMDRSEGSVHMLCNRGLKALEEEMGATWRSFIARA